MYLKLICCIINQDEKIVHCNLRIPCDEEGIYEKNKSKILNVDAFVIKKMYKYNRKNCNRQVYTDNITIIKNCKPFYIKNRDMFIKVKKRKYKIYTGGKIVELYCRVAIFNFPSSENKNEQIRGWSLYDS